MLSMWTLAARYKLAVAVSILTLSFFSFCRIYDGNYHYNLGVNSWIEASSLHSLDHGQPTRPPRNASSDLKENVPQELLVLGYFRGGSTLIGELLGQRPDTFYMYEPLYQFGRFDYFRNGYVCSMTVPECRGALNESSAAENFLTNVYNCQFKPVHNKIKLWQFSKGQGLLHWSDLPGCKSVPEDHCLNVQEQLCKMSKWVVTKEVRVGVSFLQNLLSKRHNLKVVHLVRDPRAIIHSKRQIWTKSFTNTDRAAKALCDKMMADLIGYEKLSEMFPTRVFQVQYENFALQPYNTTENIFQSLGYTFLTSDHKHLQNMTNSTIKIPAAERVWSTVRRDAKHTAWAWRATIPHHVMHFVNKQCLHVINKFHYPALKNVNELHDPNLPLICNPQNNISSCKLTQRTVSRFNT